MAPQAQAGHASRCIIRDCRCHTPYARQERGRGRGRLPFISSRHVPHYRACQRNTLSSPTSSQSSPTSIQIILAALRSGALKTERDSTRVRSECVAVLAQAETKKCSSDIESAPMEGPEAAPAGTEEGPEIDLENGLEKDLEDAAATDEVSQEGPDPTNADEEAPTYSEKLQNYMCKRLRRKGLLAWVTGKVQEVCREDADQPDDEETEIRSSLMDAIGIASVNVEVNLNDICLDDLFAAPTPMAHHLHARMPSDELPGSRIRFAGSAVTYLLKLKEDEIVAPQCGWGPHWTLDGVVETNVFVDGPSAPLRPWATV